uniref:Uncharacterized protein n=1 Tax=Fagus sylvatica TaxID=28930 RepID=A0A2N9GI80_FAGSY
MSGAYERKHSGTFQRNPESPKSLNPSDLLPPSSGLRDRPSPPCEGDRDQQWSDPGRVARFRFVFFFFSFQYAISLFFLLSTTKSEGSESPPPPLPSPPFRSTSHPSDLAVFGGDLMETLGDLSLHRHLSLRSAWICLFNGSRDPLRHLMLEPLHTRIAWYILPWQKRFDRGLPGWDYGSCSVAAPDIDGRGCS